MKNIPVVRYLKEPENGVLIQQLKNVIIEEQYSSSEIIEPHKHDYFTCLFVEKGTIELLVDLQKIKVSENTLHILFPGQVHQFLKASPLTAYYLSFDSLLSTNEALNILEQSLAEEILIRLTETESVWFRSLLALMMNFNNNGTGMDVDINTMQALATSFIFQATSLYQAREQRTISSYSSNQVNITKKFRQLVRQKFKKYKRPSEYANIMNLSVSYLNDTVKEVNGFSLTYFIQNQVILEAKRLLHYSDLSVKEVSITLGYEDEKYFNRLFSKSVGMAPGQFRKRL